MIYPSLCEMCGGGQEWTIFAGEMYVRCINECDPQLVMDGFDTLPSDSEDAGHAWSREVMGTSGGESVVPPEGAAAKMSEGDDCDLPF